MKNRMIRIGLILTFFLLFTAWGFSLQVEKGPYLIFPGENTQMTVLYQLDATSTCTLEWGTDTTYSAGSVQTTEYGSDHQHKYVIPNLTPGTKYFYRVNIGGSYHTGTFLAALPDSATDLKFLAYGDTRSYPDDHDAVCAQMINSYTNDPDYQTFIAFAADYVDNGDSESDWTTQFFGRTKLNTIGMQANLPIMGSMGNHESAGVLYQKYWPYPFEAGTRYFSYDYGPVHVVIIDQYVSYTPGSTQYTWLENDLANSTKEWKFLVFHEPGWSAGGHSNNSNVQQYIQPLCTQYEVDVVFVGHNHYYSRCLVDGVHHVTTGGGGAPLYAPNSNSDYLVTCAMVYNFCELDIQGDQLYFTAKDENGSVIDSFNVSHVFVPQLPWNDGFETGNLTSGGWMSSGIIDVQTDSYSGTYAARIHRVGYLEKSISTETFSSIHVKYARKTAALEPDEYLLVEWYDGSAWHEIERTTDTSWGYNDFACPAGADNNTFFKIKFTAVGADNKEYCFIDQVEVVEGSSTPDTTPPDPDPMTFATLPYATGSSTISMTATTASDPSGVEYFFECTAGGGNSSSWLDNPTYVDSGLQPDTPYTYRVKARDKSPNQNETAYSNTASATTQSSGGNELYVNDLAMSYKAAGSNYFGEATVWIKDTSGADMEGATVYGTWSGSVSGPAQGITGPDGKIKLTSPKNKGGGTFTFTVTDVVKIGYTYNPSLNVESTDSITI